MDVALYARVSTEEQKTIDDQILEMKKYCDLYNHEPVIEYKDKESGLSMGRKDLQRLLKDIETGQWNIQGVVVWRFDRLSRSVVDLNNIVQKFKEYNIELMSMHEQADTSKPEGKLLFNMLASIAEYEVDSIRSRTLLGLQRAKREGKLCHRPRKEIDIDRVIKLMDQGLTQEEIASVMKMSTVTLWKRLNEADIKRVSGSKVVK